MVLEADHRKQSRLLGFSWFWDVDLSCGFEWIFSRAQSFCSVLKPSSVDAQKKRVSFPSPPPRKVFRSSSPLGVMFLSLDLICSYAVMSACGSAIMLVIF